MMRCSKTLLRKILWLKKKILKNKGIKINNSTIEDEKFVVTLKDFLGENYIKISHGKKNHVIVKLN